VGGKTVVLNVFKVNGTRAEARKGERISPKSCVEWLNFEVVPFLRVHGGIV